MTPYIIEERQLNVSQLDVFSRLMMDRIIFLGTGVDDHVANIIQAQLLFLESVDSSKDVQIYINSPGGSVYAGLGIYDTMQYIKPDVATICVGQAASMGAVLLAGGAKDKRFCLENARVMIHQGSAGTQGTIADMNVALAEFNRYNDIIFATLAKHTGQPVEKVRVDCDRDFFMSAEQSKDYGVVDKVLKPGER